MSVRRCPRCPHTEHYDRWCPARGCFCGAGILPGIVERLWRWWRS